MTQQSIGGSPGRDSCPKLSRFLLLNDIHKCLLFAYLGRI